MAASAATVQRRAGSWCSAASAGARTGSWSAAIHPWSMAGAVARWTRSTSMSTSSGSRVATALDDGSTAVPRRRARSRCWPAPTRRPGRSAAARRTPAAAPASTGRRAGRSSACSRRRRRCGARHRRGGARVSRPTAAGRGARGSTRSPPLPPRPCRSGPRTASRSRRPPPPSSARRRRRPPSTTPRRRCGTGQPVGARHEQVGQRERRRLELERLGQLGSEEQRALEAKVVEGRLQSVAHRRNSGVAASAAGVRSWAFPRLGPMIGTDPRHLPKESHP